MDFSAPHIDFVIIAYALSGVCLIGLLAYIFWRDRALAKAIQKMNVTTKP
jgi:heme exporter protein CcmD